MLTILYPNIMPLIQEYPCGLLPLNVPEMDYPTLVVKVPKEYILAAKLNKSIKMYFLPVEINGCETYSLITAFFDDYDEPLILKTVLFSDDFAHDLISLINQPVINVNFFDELSREILHYQASIDLPNLTKQTLIKKDLLPASIAIAKELIKGIETKFSTRTSIDDTNAVSVNLHTLKYGEDILIQDLRPEFNDYHGASGWSHTQLERAEPGRYQEEDIIRCLLHIFKSNQIYLSPKRVYDNEEICDIMVVTENNILFIQAKDSPNIERISKQTLTRKRSNILSALNKAIRQVKGSLGYFHREKDKF